MGKIKQLDTQIANMIAAGEVVERPLGVVKELVENAIDAKATRIRVSVEDGGIQKITVEDNGHGMDREDAVACFQRHATSKIHHQNDLWRIHSLGFRGEALPSIASVSKVTLITSDGVDSTRVQIIYGEMQSVSDYPCNQGTEITVEGLFYKTPARLKHLRSGAYENSLIQDVIFKFAMSHPEISFSFYSQGKESFRSTGQGNLLEVLYQAWGTEAAKVAIPVDFQDYDYHVTGYIVKPNLTRATRNFMNLFLNGRMVKTYRLHKAILDGYEDFIVKGRNPMVILNIEMDPQILDVNVHPSKWEVRLSKEKQLEFLIRTKIYEVLKNTMLAPSAEVKAPAPTYYEPIRLDTDTNLEEPFVFNRTDEQNQIPIVDDNQAEIPELSFMIKDEVPLPSYIEENAREVKKLPEMQVIGQLHRKFILCAVEEGLAVLDQHACQERVHYEEIRQKLNTNPIMTDCLVPITIKTSDALVNRLDELNQAVADVHIVFEAFGHDTLMVRSVPLWMKEINEESFLLDLIEYFKEEAKISYAHLEKKKIATLACHSSIRFNRSLSMDEMKEVVRQLRECDNPYHCPHGRPTFVILDEKTLVKEFLR